MLDRKILADLVETETNGKYENIETNQNKSTSIRYSSILAKSWIDFHIARASTNDLPACAICTLKHYNTKKEYSL